MRITKVRASAAMIVGALMITAAGAAWQVTPERGSIQVDREPFLLFPRRHADWQQLGPPQILDADVARVLAADDYHSVSYARAGDSAEVGLFMAYYDDQRDDGVHSPEVCLPGAGWEIAWLERTDVAEMVGSESAFNINKAIIQRGEARMMVYYWFEQKGRRIAWDFAAKYWLMVDTMTTRRTDGALVRLTTPILEDETDADAERRLNDLMLEVLEPLPRFIPDA